MGHTLTQPEEVELFWKEIEQGNITPGLQENKTERTQDGWQSDSSSAYWLASKPQQQGTDSRC
jgi:hypothetical protein